MDNDRCAIDAGRPSPSHSSLLQPKTGGPGYIPAAKSALSPRRPVSVMGLGAERQTEGLSRGMWPCQLPDRRETVAKTLFKQMRDVNHPLHKFPGSGRQTAEHTTVPEKRKPHLHTEIQ
ncbi:hypothetical protein Bbelb_036080 [Branchiostoma belcheri]|nr:hypothetical protein Bbelb_036080 [Branchiostoma belcheri]